MKIKVRELRRIIKEEIEAYQPGAAGPDMCASCGKEIEPWEEGYCEDCKASDVTQCSNCGTPFTPGADNDIMCPDCRNDWGENEESWNHRLP